MYSTIIYANIMLIRLLSQLKKRHNLLTMSRQFQPKHKKIISVESPHFLLTVVREGVLDIRFNVEFSLLTLMS